MKCPNCGTEQPKNAKFCRKCGFRLDGMTCPGCGNPVPSSARYCGVCGAPLNPKRKGRKIALIVVLCLALVVGGVVGAWKFIWSEDAQLVKAAENYEEVNEALLAVTTVDGYDDLTTAEKAEQVLSTLDDLADEGKVLADSVGYNESYPLVYYSYADGAYGGVMLEGFTGDTFGIGGESYDTNIYKDEERGWVFDPWPSVPTFGTDASPYESELSALVVCDMGACYEKYLEYAQSLQPGWNEAYLETTLVEDGTLSFFRTGLSGYDLIVIWEHGEVYPGTDGEQPVIILQEVAGLVDDSNTAHSSGSLSAWRDLHENRIGQVTDGTYYFYFLMPSFFSYYYGDGQLADSIIWVGGCYGYYNDALVSVLADCGAKAVLGASDSVIGSYDFMMLDAFVYTLLCGETVEESLTFAEQIWGENDWIFAANRNLPDAEEAAGAEIHWYNGGDETLVTLTAEAQEIAQQGTCSGAVLDAADSSALIIGATITVTDADGTVAETTTDENGAFEIKLYQGTYTVQIEMEGYESQTEEVTIEAGEESVLLVSLSAEITDADARADELFERYINNVLVPEYGRLESGATSEMSSDGGDTGVWLQSGVMTSVIEDLDGDGTEECMVFLLVREKKDGEDGVALYANIYEIAGGEVALSDSMYLDRIDDSDWYQHGWNGSLVDVDGSLYFIFETCEWPNEYYAMELNRSVNDMTYSVEEAYMVYAYDGETLEKTHAYQKDGGVAYGGVEYYEYVYENGEVSDSNWLYSSINAAEVDKSGMVYDTYIEAIEYFGGVYNLSVDETLMSDTGRYWANMSESIFLDSDRLTRLFAHSVLTEDKESPYTYEQTFIDDTDKDQSEYDQKTDDSDTEIEDGTPNEASRKAAVSDIVLDTAYTDDYYEFGNIYAYDSNGNLVWSYATGSYPATELNAISEIGLRDGRYYFVEGGTVVAMDASTGAVLWENSDFGSYGASAAFAENCICLAGYYGPDFYAVSYGGTTLCEISSFGSEYYWASNVTISGNTALVSLNDGYCEAQIDLATWSYAISDAG